MTEDETIGLDGILERVKVGATGVAREEMELVLRLVRLGAEVEQRAIARAAKLGTTWRSGPEGRIVACLKADAWTPMRRIAPGDSRSSVRRILLELAADGLLVRRYAPPGWEYRLLTELPGPSLADQA